MKSTFDTFKLLRETDQNIEKIKAFKVINRQGYYDILFSSKFYFFDAIGLRLFEIKTKKDLSDKMVMDDLVKMYQYMSVAS